MKKILVSVVSLLLLSAAMFFVACEKEDQKNAPLIQNVLFEGSQVGPFTVKATILDDNGDLKSAELYFKINTATTFTAVTMTKGADNVYSAEIPAQAQGDVIYYYIKAVNSVDLTSFEPAGAPDATKQYTVSGINYAGVVINEIWAGGPTDDEKFIELFNKSTEPIDISGVYFERNNDGTVGTIPANTILAAGAYYILGTKNNTINPNDPNAPYDNSISSGFSAKKSIRFKMLTPAGDPMDMFLRGDEANLDVTISDLAPMSFCRIPNGTGVWKAVDNATLRAANDPTGAIDIPNSK
jgi:hypothetical protein